MRRFLLVSAVGLLLAAAATAASSAASVAAYPEHTLFISGKAMTMDGRPISAAEVRRQFGYDDKQTVLVKADFKTGYEAFMRVVNELQAQNCLKVGLIVEDAPKGGK